MKCLQGLIQRGFSRKPLWLKIQNGKFCINLEYHIYPKYSHPLLFRPNISFSSTGLSVRIHRTMIRIFFNKSTPAHHPPPPPNLQKLFRIHPTSDIRWPIYNQFKTVENINEQWKSCANVCAGCSGPSMFAYSIACNNNFRTVFDYCSNKPLMELQCKSYSHFSAKNINVFAIFLDRNFNGALANNFVKFWTAGPWVTCSAHDILEYLFFYYYYFSQKKKVLTLLANCKLHEMSNPVYWGK